MDPYRDYQRTPDAFGRSGRAVTPSDTVDLAVIAKAVVALTAGNLAIMPAEGSEPIAFSDVPAGFIPPYQVRRVMATGTTATVATIEG